MSSAPVRTVAARPAPGPVRYSICTLVTDHGQHRAMVESFRRHGFGGDDCEFLILDNAGSNALTAYDGLNRLLEEARGDLVVLCHQDVRLVDDGRAELDARLAALEAADPAWAVAGNAGGVAPGKLAIRITDPHGSGVRVGDLPERSVSLDENFMVVKRRTRLGFSRDMQGFHFYGADLCLAADVLGHTSYVIDFHLQHLSEGRMSPAFYECERAFRAKWSRALRARWVQTTCSLVFVSGERLAHWLGGRAQPLAGKLARRRPGARGWTRPVAKAAGPS